jgi:hypothetical protein
LNPQLQRFIAERCHLDARETIKLKDFLDRFHEWLPDAERRDWTRSRLILELGKTFAVGIDSSRILRIAGLSFEAPKGWTVEAGKLKQA